MKSEDLSAKGLGCPGWTPDGQHLVMPVRTNLFNAELYFISDRGRSVKQITHFDGLYRSTPFPYRVSLSPNSQWAIGWTILNSPLKANLPEGPQLLLISTDGQIVKYLGDFGGTVIFPWSPDSRFVAASLIGPDSDPQTRAREINIIDVQTKEIKQITFDGSTKDVFDWR
ncbi:MAG: hypothetical protein HZB51_08375 [Chloroflexi bacterium]|nr:hypothetical protein [Chloroflexota bacterium]